MPIKFILQIFLLLTISLTGLSQNDSLQIIRPVNINNRFYTFSEQQAKLLYKNELKDNYPFINGREYKMYHIARQSSPLFMSSRGLEGTVFSGGEAYHNLILIYDIYKDELIYVTPFDIFNNNYFIVLNRAVIDSFTVDVKISPGDNSSSISKQYHFVNVDFPENSTAGLKDGYYEVAVSGDIKLFVQHKAIKIKNQGVDAMQSGVYKYMHILDKTLLINGRYYKINKKRAFLKLFPEKRKAINAMLREYALRFDKLDLERVTSILRLINSI